jgi:hypothetical protein
MEYTPIRAGESLTTYCLECASEFEITNEPKATEISGASVQLRYCPFCGSEDLDCNFEKEDDDA